MSFLGLDTNAARALADLTASWTGGVEKASALITEAEQLAQLPTNTLGPLDTIASDGRAMHAALNTAAEEAEAFRIQISSAAGGAVAAGLAMPSPDQHDGPSELDELDELAKTIEMLGLTGGAATEVMLAELEQRLAEAASSEDVGAVAFEITLQGVPPSIALNAAEAHQDPDITAIAYHNGWSYDYAVSIVGTAENLDVPLAFAKALVDEAGIPHGEAIVAVGGVDLERPDIRDYAENPIPFEGFIAALAAVAVTDAELTKLEEAETAAVDAHIAFTEGREIDEDALAEQGLTYFTVGGEHSGRPTWHVIRNAQGITIAAWIVDPLTERGLGTLQNASLGETTASFRRDNLYRSGPDEIYQGFLDSNDFGETDAAAFAFYLTGDEQLAEDVRLGAWPGNYDGVVVESAITDPHIWFDVLGTLPVAGEFFDGVNAFLYLLEGDPANAAISGAATVPFLGSTIGLSRSLSRFGDEIVGSVIEESTGTVIHTIRRADGSIYKVVQVPRRQLLPGGSGLAQRPPNVARVNGRRPVNWRWAGRKYEGHLWTPELNAKYPDGVRFDANGFPDFTPYADETLRFGPGELTGNSTIDSAAANAELGFPKTPDGYVWHHVEDGQTLILIPVDVHNAVRHTGGSAIIKGTITYPEVP